ncbi:DUF5681 domain-containing protein [Sphingomonas sp. SRS2]|uniref:DUF5681 domain-containing protein n=1 Tax=Sphingomonas sp. SRS2 TaxID=133190 RepID=UPI0006184F2B|nr:DUF5681 domain-containing protein [Sphingomonas sp. SRS2]KKC26036.1 hypothetical protein WP12_10470 [Sphingomonas sp. SRS2]
MSTNFAISPRPRTRIVAAPDAAMGNRLVADLPPDDVDANDPASDKKPWRKREPNCGSFAKGVSGNPYGRPKKAKGSKAIVRKVLLEPVDVRVKGERKKKMTTFQALVMQERKAAFEGDWRARSTMFALARWALVDVDDETGDIETPAVDAAGELTDTGRAILDWFAEEVRAETGADAQGGVA